MSCIVIQVGQCGNQVGYEFWDLVRNDVGEDNCFVMNNPNNGRCYYRSINVDTEAKVVNKMVRQGNDASCIFRPSCAITEKCGRGNNWAMGYYMGKVSHADDIFERTMEELRRECERGDSHGGTLIIHSLSGGTGSGVSSRISEIVREEFSSKPLLACSVAPFEAGDAPVQNYNSLLALHKLYECCDAILLHQNDWLMERVTPRQLGGKKQMIFSDINRLVANVLAGLFMPIDNNGLQGTCKLMMDKMLGALNPDENKIILSDSVFQGISCWDNAASKMLNNIRPLQDNAIQKKLKRARSNRAYAIVARGTKHLSLSDKLINSLNEKVSIICNVYNNIPDRFWKSYNSLSRADASMTLAYKDGHFTKDYLSKTLHLANEKFKVRAYIHWYERYGGSIDDFKECFNYFHRLQKFV